MHTALPDFVAPLAEGLWAIDTGFMRAHFDAAYLVVDAGRAAFVDTGTAFGVPRLLAALDALGLARDAVQWVIPTHVHLDHAGGAGVLMRALPAARLLVHPRGARHLIDPTALWAGATAVYGPDEMARAYGEAVPIAAERVDPTSDGMRVALGARALEFADTPGHARHHHCLWDEASGGWFTGDCFGLAYPELATPQGPWMLPTTTPVQFEPDALERTIGRLLARRPRWMYLTHFGRVGGTEGDVQRLGAQLLDVLARMVELGRRERHLAPAARHEALKRGLLELYAGGLHAHGGTMSRAALGELLAVDLELNAQGMAVWLDR